MGFVENDTKYINIFTAEHRAEILITQTGKFKIDTSKRPPLYYILTSSGLGIFDGEDERNVYLNKLRDGCYKTNDKKWGKYEKGEMMMHSFFTQQDVWPEVYLYFCSTKRYPHTPPIGEMDFDIFNIDPDNLQEVNYGY